MKYPNVKCDLIGGDGNAFTIMGKVTAEMKRQKVPAEEIEKYMEEAMSGDYNNLLVVTMNWVDVC